MFGNIKINTIFAETIIFTKMIRISQKEIKGLQDGTLNQNDFANSLIEKYTVKEIALAFAELLGMKDMPVANNKISVTDDELKAITDMFRIKGSSPRGRKPKKAEE